MEGRASWLLHIINTKFTYLEGTPHIRIRIFGFVLYDNLNPKKQKIKKKKIKNIKIRKQKEEIPKSEQKKVIKKKIDKNMKEIESRTNDEAEHKKDEVFINNHKSDTIRIDQTHKQVEENVNILDKKDEDELRQQQKVRLEAPKIRVVDQEQQGVEDVQEEGAEEEKSSILKKILLKMKRWKEMISTFFIQLKKKIIKWFETLVNIKQKIGLISDFIKDELNREGFHIIYSSIKKLLKHLLPTKLKSRIVFGTGDPCSTGQALGFMGILYSFYGDKIQVIPDFENKRLEGKHEAQGRIRLITILLIVIKLMLNKRFKQLKRNFLILKEAL
jgi:hypothetical protein